MRLFIAFAALACGPALLAQTPADKPARDTCPALMTRQVRVSEIVPGGSLAGFREALADHSRWYANHGYRQDRFTLSEVVYESGFRRGGKGPVKVMTVHSPMSDVPRDKQDAGWQAFVAKYKANSRIVSTTVTCENFGSGRVAAAVNPRRLAR